MRPQITLRWSNNLLDNGYRLGDRLLCLGLSHISSASKPELQATTGGILKCKSGRIETENAKNGKAKALPTTTAPAQ